MRDPISDPASAVPAVASFSSSPGSKAKGGAAGDRIQPSTAIAVCAALGETLRGWRHLDQLYRNTPAEVPAREIIAERRDTEKKKYLGALDVLRSLEPRD